MSSSRPSSVEAKQAGVSALMLVSVQKTKQCPGPWYNGLQLCDHINGSYPVEDGTLEQWQAMLREIKPMRLMWWTNPTYWSTQGPVWADAKRSPDSGVGKWFSWGPEDCEGVSTCSGRNCAQGSWGSEMGFSGIESAMASFGSEAYASYLVDAMAHSWTRNLGIDGYCEDVSANYPCMMNTRGKGSLPYWYDIVERVREEQPQVVMSGEGYSSWDEVIRSNANMGGQGFQRFHDMMKQAVMSGDASKLEHIASSSGADAATVLCYLHPAFDGKQPGGCPTMYFRDKSATIRDVKKHLLWVALEAGSGIVSQHDYGEDKGGGVLLLVSQPARGVVERHERPIHSLAKYIPKSSPVPALIIRSAKRVHRTIGAPMRCAEGEESPLWAFTKHRALNRLALRTKLSLLGESKGALVYLKHDSLGPLGEACIMVFNPGEAQDVTIDLSPLPPTLLTGSLLPHNLLDGSSLPPPPLSSTWTVSMAAGEVRAYGNFSLGSFVPRAGKRGRCTATDGYSRLSERTTLQGCFLDCLTDHQCENVFLEFAHIHWMEPPPPLVCSLLGSVTRPSQACLEGSGTLVRKLPRGRPQRVAASGCDITNASLGKEGWDVNAEREALTEYRSHVLGAGATYNISEVAPLTSLPVLTRNNTGQHPEWEGYLRRIYGSSLPYPLDLNRFSWFYWFAPLHLSHIFLADWSDPYEQAPYGTPWTGGYAAWDWGPEHLVRRAGFFVHRPRWEESEYQLAPRLEVMRCGPIPRQGFVEGEATRKLWFYHAVGSGVYLSQAGFTNLQVKYEVHMSVPRVELVAHLRTTTGLSPACIDGFCQPSEFWPSSVHFQLHDGTPCDTASQKNRILSCNNMPIPLWSGNDPWPECSAAEIQVACMYNPCSRTMSPPSPLGPPPTPQAPDKRSPRAPLHPQGPCELPTLSPPRAPQLREGSALRSEVFTKQTKPSESQNAYSSGLLNNGIYKSTLVIGLPLMPSDTSSYHETEGDLLTGLQNVADEMGPILVAPR
ncbi:MAG: hypothetical protein SGPRY_001289, partial [Prymnesium sp.]